MPYNFRNCAAGKYHWFKVLNTNPSTQLEVCKYCGERKVYRFTADGKLVNEQQYFLDHIRAFAQPYMGEVYYDCNPGMLLKFTNEANEQKKAEVRSQDMTEKLKFAMKRAFEDKDDGITKK